VYPADEPLAVVELTTGGAQASDSLPWVIGLHGLGDKPVGFAQLFANLPFQVHVYVPRALLPWGSGYDWFGVRVKGDPQALSEALETAADEVVGLIAKLATDPRNIGKPIVTGFSQGGMLSFALATQHPGTLTAALPIGGWLPPPAWPTSKPDASIPIIAFHGEADAIVPFAPTKRTIAHLEQVGFDVSLSSYPGLGHSINSSLRTAWVHALSLRVAEVRK
jgi:phospholipase/carboxylesterase